MPIEFHCFQCDHPLQVDNEDADTPVRCPNCGMEQPPPTASVATQTPLLPEPSPAGAPQVFARNELEDPAGNNVNPYASPRSEPNPSSKPDPNAGPSWEREGASLASLFASAKEMLFSPLQFFSQMRRGGGFWRPLSFAMWASAVGLALWLASWIVFTIITLALRHKLPIDDMATMNPRQLGQKLGRMGVDFCGSGLLVAVAITFHLACSSALIHLILLMFGSAKHPFQTTFRIMAYAVGGTMLVSAIPLCGLYIAIPMQPIYVGIGLKQAQETPAGTAVVVVLLALFLCGLGLSLLSVKAANGFG